MSVKYLLENAPEQDNPLDKNNAKNINLWFQKIMHEDVKFRIIKMHAHETYAQINLV